MIEQKSIVLNTQDIKKVIAEKYNVEPNSIKIEVSTDHFYGNSNVYAQFYQDEDSGEHGA